MTATSPDTGSVEATAGQHVIPKKMQELIDERLRNKGGLYYHEMVPVVDLLRSFSKPAPPQSPGLREALEPFTDLFIEGSEDFADDETVVCKCGRTDDFTLTLGHFRRLRAALAAQSPVFGG